MTIPLVKTTKHTADNPMLSIPPFHYQCHFQAALLYGMFYHHKFMEEASLPYLIDEETKATCGLSAGTSHGSKAQP